MKDTMTMAVALPVETERRPRKSAAKRAHRRRYRMQILAAVAAVLIAVTVRAGPVLGAAEPGVYRPVELILQNPELPNGCEVTSLAMVLSGAGCPADKLALYRDYMPKADFSQAEGRCYGPNPERWYVGDAEDRTGGWYCFQGPVVQAANGWLDHCGSSLRAQDLTGLSRTELERYAQAGTPLVVWVTLRYAAPQYSEFFWVLEDGAVYRPYRNLHCVVLAGVQNGQYKIADPINGMEQVDKEIFWDSFSAMGCRAVSVE